MASGPQPFRLQQSKTTTSTTQTVVQTTKGRSGAHRDSANGVWEEHDHRLVNGATYGSDPTTSNDFTTSTFTSVTVNGSDPEKSPDSDCAPGFTGSSTHVTFQEKGSDVVLDLDPDHQCAFMNDKIQLLQEQKRVLQDRWSHMESASVSSESDCSNLDHLYESYINRLLQQVNTIYKENGDIQSKLVNFMGSVHEVKDKYEDEIGTRTQFEYDFVHFKKDLDTCSLEKTKLEAKKKELLEMMELLRAVYKHEIEELMVEAKDVSVIVEMDSGCSVDLERIVEGVREQYEALAAKSRDEAEALSWNELEERAARARKCGNDLLSSRSEISELSVKIQKLRSEILALQDQSTHLEKEVDEATGEGVRAVEDADEKLKEVEAALKKAREDMARQLREYQQLMNVKLSLDMEIATYKKLLESEESRIQVTPATVVSIHSRHVSAGRASEWAGSTSPQPKHRYKKRSQSMLFKPKYN